MKISGTGGVSSPGTGAQPRSAAAPGFAVSTSSASGAAQTARAAATGGVGSVEALIALQEADGPLERRRRQVKRAGRLLDVLDELKLAMLAGEPSSLTLQRLARAVDEAREQTHDLRLDGVLDEVETRAAVELAKAEMSRRAA
jgi:hypothetical protein